MRISLIFVFLLCIIGCKESPKKTYYKLLNNNFLQFVDTVAYKTGRLIQIPNDTSNEFKFENLCIEIDTTLGMPVELSASIQNTFRSQKLPDFEKLFLDGAELSIDKIELTELKNTGRFNLFTIEQINKNRCSKIVGKIRFYSPLISKGRAIITLTISESSKAGYTKVYLFNEQNGNWENIKVLEIERW
jgi:hypothetical protein